MKLDDLPYVRAHYYGPVRDPACITMIVLHTAETDESSTAAEGVANYFASGTVVASTQLTVDDNSAVRCVLDGVVPYGAGEGDANTVGLHIEICGRAGQTSGEWDDAYSRAALANTADLCREWLVLYPQIKPVFISTEELRHGVRGGFTGHVNYHEAFPYGDVRTDPGVNFPWERLLAMIKGTVPPHQELPDMPFVMLSDGFAPTLVTEDECYEVDGAGSVPFVSVNASRRENIINDVRAKFRAKLAASAGGASTGEVKSLIEGTKLVP